MDFETWGILVSNSRILYALDSPVEASPVVSVDRLLYTWLKAHQLTLIFYENNEYVPQ